MQEIKNGLRSTYYGRTSNSWNTKKKDYFKQLELDLGK